MHFNKKVRLSAPHGGMLQSLTRANAEFGLNPLFYAGNEADAVFMTKEKKVIFNNPLNARTGQIVRNSLHFRFSFFTQVTHYKMTKCFQLTLFSKFLRIYKRHFHLIFATLY